MHSLWNPCLLLPLFLLLSLHVIAFNGQRVKDAQRPDNDTEVWRRPPPPHRPHGSGLAPASPMFGTKYVDFPDLPLSWPLSSSKESDEGVLDEQVDFKESTETPRLYPDKKGLIISRLSDTKDETSKESIQPTKSLSGEAPPRSTQEQTLKYNSAETNISILDSNQTEENQPTSPPSPNKTTDGPSASRPLGSLSSVPESTSPLWAGARPHPEHPTPPIAIWGRTTGPSVVMQDAIQGGTVPGKETGDELIDIMGDNQGMKAENDFSDDSKENGPLLPKTSGTLFRGGGTETPTTPCKTSNQSWTPTYPEDFTPTESPRPDLTLGSALFIPLYSDWNSALATWGFAWEAHVYGLGSVFSVFCLISVVCLLGLPLRCPAGSPYFFLLHLFLLAFEGIQAFCLLYDAYNHQDRLPPLGSLLLSELSFPCLISAFSLAFILLSLRSRMHLSFPLANSTSFSAFPKPCLLLCMSMLYSGVSLGCVGLLQLFPGLPSVILLFPQGVFVCLTIFLPSSYLVFYCSMQFNTKHLYRLNDTGESGGSPAVTPSSRCPFSKVEDWGRAAGAGLGAALCLLGCGGLQFYGILHALGLGGVDSYGFQPWPWWGYQVGCRLCEIGVCLGLSIIGSHPLFCPNNSSIESLTNPRPGSWSRLSCDSRSRGLIKASREFADSPVVSSHDSWCQGKQEKLVVCDVISKEQSEALPLFSMVDHPQNRLIPSSSQTHSTAFLTPPNPRSKPKNAVESQLSSLDSLRMETDSTVDLRPPSLIDLSRSIDQALFSESLFSHSIFGLPRLFHASSSLSLSSPSQGESQQGPGSVQNALFRTISCGDMEQDNAMSALRPSKPNSSLTSQSKSPLSPKQWNWKESVSDSTQGLWSNPKETEKWRSHSWANRGQNFAQSSLPRAIPHLSYHRRYRTLSLASQDSCGSGRLAGTKHLSESKQLEWDLAVQAEFVNVCRQIDTLSVCSDTIEL
ncbi:proline-rich transmembrane protein 4 [Spinachia spinachia]